MSSITVTRIHHVVSIKVEFKEDDGAKWMEFTLIDANDGMHDVIAFVDKPLAIEGAEFVALMARPTPDDDVPEGSLVPLLRASIEDAKATFSKKGRP